MTPQVARHAQALGHSGIRIIGERVGALGRPVIGLHLGELDFATPEHITQAVSAIMATRAVGYAPTRGLPELVDAISVKLATANNVMASSQQIVVTAGGTQAIHLAICAIVQAGDEVLVPDPGWPNYAMAVGTAQARAVSYCLTVEPDMLPSLDQLAGLLSRRTRAIIVNSPSNPLGTVLPRARAEMLVEFALRNRLWLISDECYENFVFEGEHVSLASLAPDVVLSCFSFSKTYAMTGFRLGYLVGPANAVDVCVRLQEATLACVNTPAQWAAVAALTGPHDFAAAAISQLRHRRALADAVLRNLGLRYVLPDGAFYVWIALPSSESAVPDDVSFALNLVEDRSVAVVPGSAFGKHGMGWLRASLTVDDVRLRNGLRQIGEALGVRS